MQEPPHPFFGSRPLKRQPVQIKDAFNPFHHAKVAEASAISAFSLLFYLSLPDLTGPQRRCGRSAASASTSSSRRLLGSLRTLPAPTRDPTTMARNTFPRPYQMCRTRTRRTGRLDNSRVSKDNSKDRSSSSSLLHRLRVPWRRRATTRRPCRLLCAQERTFTLGLTGITLVSR